MSSQIYGTLVLASVLSSANALAQPVDPPPEGPISEAQPAPVEESPAQPPPPAAAPNPPPAAPAFTATAADPVAPPPAAPPPRATDPDARRHDGFYARFGAGFAGYHQSFTSEDIDPTGKSKGSLSGVAAVSEFAVGGTISTGFVLGVGVYGASVLASDYHHESGAPLPIEFGEREFAFNVIGPFFDYYFDEKKGLHFQGALGFAHLSGLGVGATAYDEDQYKASGGGVMLGIGHEWWVADNWGIGLVGRAMLGVVTGQDDADVRWVHVITTSPSILFTVTYH